MLGDTQTRYAKSSSFSAMKHLQGAIKCTLKWIASGVQKRLRPIEKLYFRFIAKNCGIFSIESVQM